MKKSTSNLPDTTKVPDENLALQRKRIAALRPETDKLLARIAKVSAPEAMLLVVTEGLAKMTETCKILSLAIHDVRGHQAPFTACQDEFCQITKRQIDGGAALVVTASELKPERQTDAPISGALVEAVEKVIKYSEGLHNHDGGGYIEMLQTALANHEKEKSHG